VVQISLVVDQVGNFIIQRLDGDDIVTIEVDIRWLREISIGHPCSGTNDQYKNPVGSFPENQK